MFPQFTNYSIPLIILYSCGIIFTLIFFYRFFQRKNISDLLLAGIFLIYTYERTTYTIGFMAWYDTFPNTKINYFLIPFMLAFGPLVFFYVKSVIQSNFRFRKKDIWHFVPQLVFVFSRLIIYLYDLNQPGFDDVQNGILFQSLVMNYLGFFIGLLTDVSVAVYLILSCIMYYKYRRSIKDVFSNLLKWEFHWLRNFLLLFIAVYIIMFVLQEIDGNLTDLHYTDYWWGHLAAGLSLVYLGIHGYLIDVQKLHSIQEEAGINVLTERQNANAKNNDPLLHQQIQKVNELMEIEKLYLNNTLTLSQLAKRTGFNTGELSQIINTGSGKNFNDYVNSYRIEAVKSAIAEGKTKQFTLLSIAYECGFNSKATFNRTFKKFTEQSPSEYVRNQGD